MKYENNELILISKVITAFKNSCSLLLPPSPPPLYRILKIVATSRFVTHLFPYFRIFFKNVFQIFMAMVSDYCFMLVTMNPIARFKTGKNYFVSNFEYVKMPRFVALLDKLILNELNVCYD